MAEGRHERSEEAETTRVRHAWTKGLIAAQQFEQFPTHGAGYYYLEHGVGFEETPHPVVTWAAAGRA
jgi:hypothetical protein